MIGPAIMSIVRVQRNKNLTPKASVEYRNKLLYKYTKTKLGILLKI
jgi:hypothetical protein